MKDDQEIQLQTVELLMQEQKYDAAEKSCLKLLKTYPKYPEAYILMSDIIKAKSNDFQFASELIIKAINLSPQTALFHYKLGHNQYRESQFLSSKDEDKAKIHELMNQAILSLRRALTIDRKYYEACLLAAKIFYDLSDIVSAKLYFEYTRGIMPSDGVSHYYLYKIAKLRG